MNDPIKENWWLGVAALMAGLQLVLGVGIWVDKLVTDTTRVNGVVVDLPDKALLVWGDILLTSLTVLATAAIVAGLYLRSRRPERSRRLIMIGVLPSVLIGAVFFWFPPFWIVSGAAIAVVVRASKGAMREPVAA